MREALKPAGIIAAMNTTELYWVALQGLGVLGAGVPEAYTVVFANDGLMALNGALLLVAMGSTMLTVPMIRRSPLIVHAAKRLARRSEPAGRPVVRAAGLREWCVP
jgi:hypothetical protein